MFFTLFVSGLVLGCVYGLIGLGYSLIYNASGLMSFVQGDLMTVGAYLALTFFAYWGLPYWMAFILVAVIMFFFGIGIEKFIIRRMRSKNVTFIYIVLATIALGYIIQDGCQKIWGTASLYFPSAFKTQYTQILGREVQTEYIFIVCVSIVMMLALQFFMKYTRVGTSMRAAAGNRLAAAACGINVNLSTGLAWGIAACTAALSGMMLGPVYSVYSTLGLTIGTKGYAAAVIGGYGNFYGAIVGGLILGQIEMMVSGFVSSDYKNLITYAILIIVLFVRPWGIFNARNIKN